MSTKTIYGIDLGTTYSCIAKVDDARQPVVLPNLEGDLTTPSVVFFESETSVVVGKDARDPLNPDRVAAKFKRKMGDEDWRFEAHGQSYRPQEISAHVLRKLAADAKAYDGTAVEEVVITCPAYFGVAQKEATRQAGELAGLTVRHVIPEPTAAAIAYGLRSDKEETVLVYDLGGGTFDITLIDIRKDKLHVLTTGGDAELGGADWDSRLAQAMARYVAEQAGDTVENVVSDKERYADLLYRAEDAKRALTSREKTTQFIAFAGEKYRVELSREDFDAMTQDLLQRTLDLTNQVLATAKDKGHPAPTRICMVGGSSFMPQVRRMLDENFPALEKQLEDPNQIVAKGAALFGLMTALDDRVLEIINQRSGGDAKTTDEVAPAVKAAAVKAAAADFGLPAAKAESLAGKQVTNVTSRGFAIKALWGEQMETRAAMLAHVDDPVPATRVETFPLATDGSEVEIVVLETERRTAAGDEPLRLEDCKPLGDGKIELGRTYPRGTPIEVSLGLSSDGTLDVSAIHKDSGRECRLSMKVQGVMSSEDLAAAKKQVASLQMV